MQSVTVQSSAKVVENSSADLPVARADAAFDLIGFVQAAASAQTPDASAVSGATDPAAAVKPLDPLAALMNIGQLAEKGLKTSSFAEAVTADQGVKIHVFPTPDGASVDTIRDLPMITAADLEHAVSLMPASAEKDMVLSLIHDPQTIAAAMKASGLMNAGQMQVAGQDLSQVTGLDQTPQSMIGENETGAIDAPVVPIEGGDCSVVVTQAPFDPSVSDPALLAAQQALMLQPDRVPQMPAASLVLPVEALSAPVSVEDSAVVMPPEITSGPWGDYQAPVMPDERFVRFIVPKADTDNQTAAASLFELDLPERAAFTTGAAEDDMQSVMAALAETGKAISSAAGEGLSSAIASEAGTSLADKLASLAASGTMADDLAASPAVSALGVQANSGVAESTGGLPIAPSAASLFSSIFAKHGISTSGSDMPVVAGVPAGEAAGQTGVDASANPAFAALNSLQTGFVAPHHAQQALADDGAGDAIRSGLLKSLGGLKSGQGKGGLASHVFNSRNILDLAAEEGLTLAQPAIVPTVRESAAEPDMSALAAFANAGFAVNEHNNAFASAGDLAMGALSGNDPVTSGQGQSGGQNPSHQDGQTSNPQTSGQSRDERGLLAGGTGADETTRMAAALKKDEALLAGADAHQTSLATDAGTADAPAFSTASMATSSPAIQQSGSALGARETLMGVTYALAGRNGSGAGSTLTAEMRFISLGQQVMAALKQNSQEIELRLNPAQLGNVVLRLQVEGQKISISAKTESHLSDEALSVGEDGLRASLAAHGYHLDKFDVSHQEERRKPSQPEAHQSQGIVSESDDPFSFDLIA